LAPALSWPPATEKFQLKVNAMIPRHCNSVSITDVDFVPGPRAVAEFLLGRKAFGRTEYMVLRHETNLATVRVTKKRSFHLMRPIVEVHVLSTPGSTLLLCDSEVDIMSPASMYQRTRPMIEAMEAGGGTR
jgi:hypothetical protein